MRKNSYGDYNTVILGLTVNTWLTIMLSCRRLTTINIYLLFRESFLEKNPKNKKVYKSNVTFLFKKRNMRILVLGFGGVGRVLTHLLIKDERIKGRQSALRLALTIGKENKKLESLQGGIPLSEGEILNIHEGEKITLYKVIKKSIDCFFEGEDQIVNITYTLKKILLA